MSMTFFVAGLTLGSAVAMARTEHVLTQASFPLMQVIIYILVGFCVGFWMHKILTRWLKKCAR